MGNSFGTLFRISSWGESHGGGVGVVIDGCPPRLNLCEDDIQPFLDRRRPGQSKLTTPRDEADVSKFFLELSKVKPLVLQCSARKKHGCTPQAYDEMKTKFRPSHADYTYQNAGFETMKGRQASARETPSGSRCDCTKSLSGDNPKLQLVDRIHDIECPAINEIPTLEQIEASPTRCPHTESAEEMEKRILEAKKAGDSVGGTIICRINGLPVGWGAPVFDRLEADLAKAMISLPATKGFEIGSGFQGTYLKGSEHNDLFEEQGGRVRTKSNRSGGVQGGISNGEELYFRVAFKPTATVLQNSKLLTKMEKILN